MQKLISTGFNLAARFLLMIVLFTSVFCNSEEKHRQDLVYEFNIDSLLTSIKHDTSLHADDATFNKKDSLLIIYLVPNITTSDPGAMRAHFKTLHVTNVIRRAKNISGVVFVKTPPSDSLQSQHFQYQILSSFFKAGTRFAEKK